MKFRAQAGLDTWVENFNERQTEAYEFDGHCAVLAGPGSGKTRVLVAKVARLLSQRTNGPRGVACVTFNNEAVREMRKRLSELGIRRDKRLFVGTVHGFCLACIVVPFGHLYHEDLENTVTVASRRQSRLALETALDKLGIRGRLSEWQNQLTIYRRAHPIKDCANWRDDPRLAKLIEQYESILHEQGIVDFDDMILLAVNLIHRHKFVRSALEARFPFFVVDEYQDLGYPLHLMVSRLLEGSNIEIFAVGDPDQSIYGFAGSDPIYLRSLADDPDVRRIELTMNYRSAQSIIDGSEVALAAENPRGYKSARDGIVGKVIFRECPDGLAQQARTIASEIIPDLVNNGVSCDEIAILYRDKWDQFILSSALSEAGINYAGERDQRYQRTPFTRWLEDVASWCTLFPETQQGPELGDLHFWYAEFSQSAGVSLDTADLAARTEFFHALMSIASREMSLSDWLDRIDSLLNLESLLSARETNPDDLDDWLFIISQCQDGGALEGFTLDDFARCSGRPDTVILTTLHSSKGREYEAVIMPGLEEGRFPGYNAKSDEAIAEARRVFYVGMTRAKDTIYLLYSGWYKDGYDRVWKKGPSRFVRELQEKTPS